MTFRVLSAEVSHETNTFSCRRTDEQAFRNRYFLLGGEAVAQRGEVNADGGYGDATDLLRVLLDAGVTKACFGPMVDGEVAHALHSGKIGDRINIMLGGETDARFGGGPLTLDAAEIIVCDSGAPCTPRYEQLSYQNVPRPIYPLDRMDA